MPFWGWSKTAASNANSDPTINMAEGMPPAQLNDAGRAVMAGAAQYRDDTSGLLVTSGTSTAYTVTTNQGLPATPNDGQLIVVSLHAQNGASPTLAADGGTAFPIQITPGFNVTVSSLFANTPIPLRFKASASAWIGWQAASAAIASTVEAGAVPNAGLANATAWTIKGNPTGSSAAPTDFTIAGIVQKTNPVSNDLILGWDFAGARMVNFQANTLGQAFNQPTVQRFTSGSGTYTATTGTVRVKVRIVGGGGGGGAVSTNNGSSGGATSFGGWSCGGGGGGLAGANGGAGGGSGGANGAGTPVTRFSGAQGGPGWSSTGGNNMFGGYGGVSPFGGGGAPGLAGGGGSAQANTGSGGAGGATGNTAASPGGGAGEYVEFWATVAQATGSAWAVGAGGGGGAAGTQPGGNGAAGVIIVEEFYV